MDNSAPNALTPQQAADDQALITKNPVPTLSDVVEEVEEKQDDYQAMYNAGGHFKEQLESIASTWHQPEVTPMHTEKPVESVMEIPTSPEVHPEVSEYIQKVEKDTELSESVVDEYTQKVLLSSSAPVMPEVKLPLTVERIESGRKHPVWEAITWLATWCFRQLEIMRFRSARVVR